MLPAYARAIVNERAEGRHPAQIIVGIGEDWFRVNHHLYPFVFAKEAEFLVGKFDWWFVAGVPVFVESAASAEATVALLGELADWTAPIWLNYGLHYIQGAEACDLFDQIRERRWLAGYSFLEFDPANHGHCQHWSISRGGQYFERRRAQAAAARLEAHA